MSPTPKNLRRRLTPENLKKAIDLACKSREQDTKMVYTKAFRAFALEIMCDYVRKVPVTTSGVASQLEDLICHYEAGIRSGATSNTHEFGYPAVPSGHNTRPE
jgi:hypothetical protein